MLQILRRWPLMLRSTHEAVRMENYTLRDALREANNELRRHKQALARMNEDEPKDAQDEFLESVFANLPRSGLMLRIFSYNDLRQALIDAGVKIVRK